LLLTFFYRQMPSSSRGPPLHRPAAAVPVKKGKREQYIKDEAAMEQFFLGQAAEGLSVRPASADAADETAGLVSDVPAFVDLLRQYVQRLEKLERRYPPALVEAFHGLCGGVLPTEPAALDQFVVALSARLVELEPRMRIRTHRAETSPSALTLGVEFRADMREVRLVDHLENHAAFDELHRKLTAICPLPVRVKSGQHEVVAHTWSETLRVVLDLAQRGYDIQRYKGLGEMNPEQLWETTLNPSVRTLQQVNLDDLLSADTMFTILMGDAVEPRRDFIQENALSVRNLDI
jgi:DNA gyrase subunit B